MSVSYQRGMVLLGQGRFDLAEREFRQALASEPDNAAGHALLALCLMHMDRKAEALTEADEAIRLDPGEAFTHYARGRALFANDRYREAEGEAKAAIALDPIDADYYALLSTVEVARRNWQAALDAANQGLTIDAEHGDCRNLRGMALLQLGRNAEAAQSFDSALANDPENAFTHANQGWNLLHQGDHKASLEHFRESLRLNPNLEFARIGILEALKSRHVIYRVMLKFFLWMGRKSQAAQMLIIFVFVFGRRFLDQAAEANPAIAPFIQPLLALSFGFIILTWVAGPVFNFLLMFNRFGRLALKREEKIEACVVGAILTAAVGSFVANLVWNNELTFFAMFFFGFILFPVAVMFRQEPGRGRWIMLGYVLVMICMFVPLVSIALLGESGPFTAKQAINGIQLFAYGAMFSSWIPMAMGLRNAAR